MQSGRKGEEQLEVGARDFMVGAAYFFDVGMDCWLKHVGEIGFIFQFRLRKVGKTRGRLENLRRQCSASGFGLLVSLNMRGRIWRC